MQLLHVIADAIEGATQMTFGENERPSYWASKENCRGIKEIRRNKFDICESVVQRCILIRQLFKFENTSKREDYINPF